MNATSHDIALFQSVKRNNRLAFQQLFMAYYEPLCFFAFNVTNNREDAEEVVSDVFFSLWKSRHTINIEQSVKAYLYTSVKNESLARMKKNRIKPAHLDGDAPSLTDPDTPMRQLEFEELYDHVRNLVDQLPPACKQIFVLNRFNNLRYKEIAQLLEISEKTVENQIVKALSVLRKSLNTFFL